MSGLQAALTALDDWPAARAAAAVVTAEGIAAAHGPIDEVIPLASVTKPLAVLSALVAVEEGAIDLEDPADPEVVPGASVRHLMSHASGLAPEGRLRSFPPATRRVYSNVGIERLGELVAHGSGLDFSAYVAEALLEPLGLGATQMSGSPARDGRSSVRDLARVAQELLAPTGWLHPTTLADATTVQYPGLRGVLPGFGGQDPNDWGLGFEIRSHKHPHWTGTTNSPATYGHFGQSGTMFWIDPVARLGLVVLTDQAFGAWAAQAWPRLSDAVLAG